MNKKSLIVSLLPIIILLMPYFYLKVKNYSLYNDVTSTEKHTQGIEHDCKRVFIYCNKAEENLIEHNRWILFPIIILPLFLVMNIFRRKYTSTFIYCFILITAMGWYVIHYFPLNSIEADMNTINDSYDKKKFLTAKGFIEVLHRQPSGGHDQGDVILINGNKFIIDHYIISNYGYTTTINNGGILSEKKYVYIKYLNESSNSDNINNIIEIAVPN